MLIAVTTAALPIIESHYVHNGWWAGDPCLDIWALFSIRSPFDTESLIVAFEFYMSVTDVTGGSMTEVMAYGWHLVCQGG